MQEKLNIFSTYRFILSVSHIEELDLCSLLELAFDDTFVKPYYWSSILQAYSRVLHDQDFPKRVTMDVYCNV